MRNAAQDHVDWFVRHGVGRQTLARMVGSPPADWDLDTLKRVAQVRLVYAGSPPGTVDLHELLDACFGS